MDKEKFIDLEKIITNDYDNTTGIVVLQNGKTVYQNYFNECNDNSKTQIYSVTKSIISILIGIAIDKGYIKSVDTKVLEFFPEYVVKKREKTIQHITLKNLLTMTAPYKYKFNPYTKYFTSDDYVKFSLDLLGGRGKIGEFRYTPLIGPDILSAILMKSTNQSVLDFAKENLFKPLGIAVEKNIYFKSKEEYMAFTKTKDISGWMVDSKGVNTAGWGLTLSTVDMVKIGQLYLDEGIWNGKQIVSRSWIKNSTKEHSRWYKINKAYGYLWWLGDKEGDFAAMGDGGNIIYVNSKKRIVVAMSGFFKPRAKDRIEFIKKYIEPKLD